MDRRLRYRRQAARLRITLLADAAVLNEHHASRAPRVPTGISLRALHSELAALRELVSVLAARVAALSPQSVAWPPACGVDGARAVVTKERELETMAAAAVAAAGLAMAAVEGDEVAEIAAANDLVAAVGPEAKKKKTFTGTVRLAAAPGWPDCRYEGFITPDDPDSLPERVKVGLAMPGALSSPVRGLYFSGRHEDRRKVFEFGEGVAVLFLVLVNDEGAFACDLAPA